MGPSSLRSPDEYLSLELLTKRYALVAFANGFEIARVLSAKPVALRLHLGGYLQPGENLVTVSIEELPAEPGDDELPLCNAAILRGAPEMPTDPGDILAATVIDPAITRVEPGGLRTVLSHRFSRPELAPRWDFLRAPPFPEERLEEARALVRTVRAAFERRDLKTLTQLFALRTTELALAADAARDDVEADFLVEWGEALDHPDVRVTEAPVTLEPGMDGRVLYARGPDQRSPIVIEGGNIPRGVGLALAFVGGQVRIVR